MITYLALHKFYLTYIHDLVSNYSKHQVFTSISGLINYMVLMLQHLLGMKTRVTVI